MKTSICMATYNGEKYIKEQLESILFQLGIDDEIIISDDMSTDNTIDVIKSLNDSRIKVFINHERLGVVANFNKALMISSGDIIFLSDQDDIWLKNKVELCLDKINSYDLIVTNCMVTDENLNILQPSYFEVVNSGSGFTKNIYKSTYLGCCLVFKRDILDTVLPIPENLFTYHDWWIGFLADLKYSVYFEKTPLLLYRRHSTTTSTTLFKSNKSLYIKIYSRLQLLFLGIMRLIRKY